LDSTKEGTTCVMVSKWEWRILVATSVSILCIDEGLVYNKYLMIIELLEVIDTAVLDHSFESLLNLDIKQYKAVSQILYTRC